HGGRLRPFPRVGDVPEDDRPARMPVPTDVGVGGDPAAVRRGTAPVVEPLRDGLCRRRIGRRLGPEGTLGARHGNSPRRTIAAARHAYSRRRALARPGGLGRGPGGAGGGRGGGFSGCPKGSTTQKLIIGAADVSAPGGSEAHRVQEFEIDETLDRAAL